jgi:putative ABC transport system permease protein
VMVDSMRSSVSDWLQDLLSADLYIAAEEFQQDAVLPQAVVLQAPRLNGVADFSLYRDSTVQLGQHRSRMVAARLAGQSQAGFDLVAQLDADPWQRYQQGEVMISEPLAYRLQLKPGEQLLVPTPQGDRAFRIAAVFRDYATEHGRFFIDLQHYRKLWSDPQVDTLALFSSSGDGHALQQAASERFDTDYQLQYTDARAIYDESMAVFDRTFRITEVLRILSVMVAFIGILSALMAVQLERRKEFAILRALGLTRIQVSSLIMIESSILGLLAALFAVPTGLALAWVLTDAIQLRAFGWTMPFLLTAEPLFWTLLIGVSAAWLASLYPAWQASHSNPASQMRED